MEISTSSGYILLAIFSLIASLQALRQGLKAGCTLLLLAFAAYAAAAMTLLFLPIYVSIDADILPDMAVYLFQPGAWLHDVWTQMGAGGALPYLASRIAFFIPLGIAISAAAGPSCPFWRQLAIICIIAVSIELLQLGEGLLAGAIYRRVCLDDAAIAAAGSLAGLAAGRIAWRLQSFRRGATAGIRPGI